MRQFKKLSCILVIAASACVLQRYYEALWFQWEAQEGFSWRAFEENSLWLYRLRGTDGQPASSYKLTRYFSPLDPYDGPNWEIRIPGWIPAGISFVALGFSAYALLKMPRVFATSEN